MPHSSNPDCWFGVEDAAERKKIQNRLAQRARRRRKAGIKAPQCPSSPSYSSTDPASAIEFTPTLEQGSPFSTIAPVQLTPNTATALPFTTEIPPTVFAALWDNGAMMGLTCSTVVPARSQPAGPELPAALKPTILQLTTIHPIWIDRFPFPRLRDNLISLSGLVDEEDFLRDIFSLDSFTIKPGMAGWDPSAWVIRPGFGRKWGFLFN